ncbi:hypothetical protein PMAYCL1PPCAC_10623, partial [Pristionchus mayeri]
YDYKLVDASGKQTNQLVHGNTRLRMKMDDEHSNGKIYAIVSNGKYSANFPMKQTACGYLTSDALFSTYDYDQDLTIEIFNKDHAFFAFNTRFSRKSLMGSDHSPPVDCASTGAISENTDFCFYHN